MDSTLTARVGGFSPQSQRSTQIKQAETRPVGSVSNPRKELSTNAHESARKESFFFALFRVFPYLKISKMPGNFPLEQSVVKLRSSADVVDYQVSLILFMPNV